MDENIDNAERADWKVNCFGVVFPNCSGLDTGMNWVLLTSRSDSTQNLPMCSISGVYKPPSRSTYQKAMFRIVCSSNSDCGFKPQSQHWCFQTLQNNSLRCPSLFTDMLGFHLPKQVQETMPRVVMKSEFWTKTWAPNLERRYASATDRAQLPIQYCVRSIAW